MKLNKGFTLVELSIVIVIIGLIVAGVTAGQTLVKQAQLRAIVTQADQVRAAINSFRMQYNALPGDLPNGSSFWAMGCNYFDDLTSASVPNVCNGDGNKQISVGVKVIGGGNWEPESFAAWLHLNLAKLMPGFFVINNAQNGMVGVGAININIPPAKYPGAGITIGWDAARVLSATHTNGKKHFVVFGAPATDVANGAFLTPAQAASIDSKADDGLPESGSVIAGESSQAALTTCSDGTTTHLYLLATTTPQCSIGFSF